MTDDDLDGQITGVCQRTGFNVRPEDLVREWTGLLVRRSSFEPKHPMLDLPAPRGERVRDKATGPDQVIDAGDLRAPPTIAELGANN